MKPQLFVMGSPPSLCPAHSSRITISLQAHGPPAFPHHGTSVLRTVNPYLPGNVFTSFKSLLPSYLHREGILATPAFPTPLVLLHFLPPLLPPSLPSLPPSSLPSVSLFQQHLLPPMIHHSLITVTSPHPLIFFPFSSPPPSSSLPCSLLLHRSLLEHRLQEDRDFCLFGSSTHP